MVDNEAIENVDCRARWANKCMHLFIKQIEKWTLGGTELRLRLRVPYL